MAQTGPRWTTLIPMAPGAVAAILGRHSDPQVPRAKHRRCRLTAVQRASPSLHTPDRDTETEHLVLPTQGPLGPACSTTWVRPDRRATGPSAREFLRAEALHVAFTCCRGSDSVGSLPSKSYPEAIRQPYPTPGESSQHQVTYQQLRNCGPGRQGEVGERSPFASHLPLCKVGHVAKSDDSEIPGCLDAPTGC